MMGDKQVKTRDDAKLSKYTWIWKQSASWILQRNNHNNHILIIYYYQEKYDYQCRVTYYDYMSYLLFYYDLNLIM